MDTTYIDIDSTFRNRSEYPNPADFKINFDFQNNRNSISKANNIECDAYPYYQWQWGCTSVGEDGTALRTIDNILTGNSLNGNVKEIILGHSATDGNLDRGGSSITTNYTTSDNYFNGLLFKTTESGKLQSSRIDSYDTTDNLITITGEFSSDEWNDTNDWSMTNPTTTTTIFVPGGSNKEGDYVGDYYECYLYGGEVHGGMSSVTHNSGGTISAGHTGTIAVNANPTTDFPVGDTVYLSDSTKVGVVTASNTGPNTITIGGGTLVDLPNLTVLYKSGFTVPSNHQFRKIVGYDASTKLLTLESAVNIENGSNKLGTRGAVYLNTIRKGLPILPTSSNDIITDNVVRFSANGLAGSIYKIVNIISGGTGYSFGDVLTIAGTTDAKFAVSKVDSNGSVKEITILYCGTGISGTVHKPTGGGTNCEIRVALGTGIKVDTTKASTTSNEYTGQVLYVPSYVTATAGTVSDDGLAAQQFIPNKRTLNLDNTEPYRDEDHCAFEILGHFHTATGPNNIIIVKTVTNPAKFRANMEYNILPFSRDGVNNFVNNKYVNVNNLDTKYQIQLLHVTLPNTAIQTGPGGFIGNQPFVFVEFYSEGSNNRQLYNTNNPHLENVLFKCIVTDVANPSTIPFIKLKCAYPVSVNFELNKNMYFRIVMPNGETFRTFKSDTVPPNCPNKNLQVSATFALTPIKEK